MAQSSASSQSRPPHLDSSPDKSRTQVIQEQQQLQQQQQHPAALHREQLPPRSPPPPRPPHPDDTPTTTTHEHATQPTDNATASDTDGAGHILGGGADESFPGGASAVNAYPSDTNDCASIDSPGDSVEDLEAAQTGTRYHNGNTPLSTLSPMSNTQPPPGHPRQPMGYQNTSSYPPPGMPPVAHYAYPPQTVPQPDPYRPTPTALPSMRTLDHQQHHHQQQQVMAAHMAGPMASSPVPMGYYSVPPHAYSMHPDPNTMRFALAPGLSQDPRIALSGGRHKKEIKRRTKTGCLTCRKRRIKCDEAHPTCNNCKKSKRECLGYDPIFKQPQGPAAIQPAPNNAQPSPPISLAPAPTLPSSTTPQPYHHQQHQPQVVSGAYTPSLPPSITFDSPVSSTPQSVKTEPGFDFATAIDPALQGGGDTSSAGGTPATQYQHTRTEGADQGVVVVDKTKKMKVDELIAFGGAAPPTPSSPPSAPLLDEITRLYTEVYVPGLVLFFETQWYSSGVVQPATAPSVSLLHRNPSLVALFAAFLQNITNIKSTDPTDMVYAGHLETSLVWALACLPLSCAPEDAPRSSSGSVPTEDDPAEARARLRVFETLVSNTTLLSNPLSPSPIGNVNPARKSEFEFWHHLAQYLLQSHSPASPANVPTREHHLNAMRSLLDGRENRDVLYSIAVLREYTAHWDASLNEQTVPTHLEESDPRSKLAVATRFMRDESASTGGTTNVVRRFADIAYRAFVRPGLNADSRVRRS
ncbi:hypothetical protein B0H63DRAFT_388554 [Podospora didyma]|uniref:Zn(2)-C6 fungal-type domain-containing protein n=1 Tax=Podospora didyma TaxID=330526 RepID=A0AAE0JWN1_9PEZI|nr:hypothetical protein B0H63DRAFT_405619 [Podospora didyma]KAK3389483.1 hypothetical protein B0H63DRAFT_388554 [Podospora didyma]